jgi:glycosyltransferase involved in cell wall biosynthesis
VKKVLILADAPGWAFDRRAKAIQSYAPAGWDVRIEYHGLRPLSEIACESADLVFAIDPHQAKNVRQHFSLSGCKIPLVGAHNSGTGRPGYSMDETLSAADWVVVNNHAAWAANRWGQRDYRACNISNGVCLKSFGLDTPFLDRPQKALWVGSTGKADDKDDVKGYRAILSPLERILPPRLGISCDFRTATPGDALDEAGMREFYNGGRYLVVASKSEGTPNIALEGAACGCAVVTTSVGNMPELIIHGKNGRIVHRRDTVGFLDVFEFTPPMSWVEYSAGILESIKKWDWSHRAPYYYALWAALIEGRAVKPFSYLNTAPAAVGV